MTMVNSNKGTVVAALTAPLFVLALPILDTSLAILRRGSQGLPIFRPDRKHLHHRLMSMGMSRRKVVVWFYLFTLVFLVLGFLAFSSRGQMVPVLLGVAVLVVLVTAGQLNFSREWFAVGRVLGSSIEVRGEVQYALALGHLFQLEAARAPSSDSLFEDFLFMVCKLGFTQVRLRLPEGSKVWTQEGVAGALSQWRHDLGGGRSASIELGVRLPEEDSNPRETDAPPVARRETSGPSAPSTKAYEILSELAAESWLKAARQWERTRGQPLAFTSYDGPPASGINREAGKESPPSP
jgi:UDP-GlcNAc:undecaprenyl-phosphate/decaprenyl-phosphate GlcNAc-1-phosphate transferase